MYVHAYVYTYLVVYMHLDCIAYVLCIRVHVLHMCCVYVCTRISLTCVRLYMRICVYCTYLIHVCMSMYVKSRSSE